MEKPKVTDKKEFRRPTMGKRIISDKQARLLANKTVEPESFLDDPSIIEPSMDDSDRSRLPTNAEMMEAVRRNNAERAAEFKWMGRTGREVLGDLPPINFKMPARIHISSSESEAESDKENDAVDESVNVIEPVDEKEKEADETTPVGQQRSIGLAGPSKSATPTEAVVPTTPTARPNSGFRKPDLPAQRCPPRHSTPKMNDRPRDSLGAAFNDISMIANNSMAALPMRKSGGTNRESTESTTRGRTVDVASSIEEEMENEQNVSAANGTFVIEREGEKQKGMMEGEIEKEEEEVHVRVDALVMRRVSPATRDVPVDGWKERRGKGERVEVVNVSMKRQSVSAALPPQDVSMTTIEEEEEMEGGEEGEESIEMDDVEMASVNETPVRIPSKRVPKRPSLEHGVTADSSPMAVTMARRSGGLRETMVRPKVSVSSIATGRKISTGSVASSIPFEDISQNMSLTSSDRSYDEAKTPERTPRTTRLLRQSLAARELRQSQHHRLAIVDEAEVQGGEREEDEEEEEEKMEGGGTRRISVMGTALSHSPATPINRLPRLSQKLQSSVDRLSQPRNRHSPTRPCSRMISPARAPLQRGGRLPQQPSPSPARRVHVFNDTRATSGYTPNHRFDTTMMEDEEGVRSGMAPRIRRIPRREEGKKVVLSVLNVSVVQSDIEQERKEREKAATMIRLLDGSANQSKEMSVFSNPVASLVLHNDDNNSFDNQSFDDDDDDHGEREEEEEEEEDGEEGDFSHHNHSMVSSIGGGPAISAASDDDIFVRPHLPTTPKTAPVNKSRRSTWSESMDNLSSRASLISIESAVDGGAGNGGNGAASWNGSFDHGESPKTPFRAAIARNSDLYSTDTPGMHRHRISMMDTEEEEEWADNQDSVLWRGNVTTEEDENEGDATEASQLSIVEEEDADERILVPRKIIAPTASPGVRRSTRNRIKPTRTWLGEQAQYANSPITGERRLVGVNEVVIRDKLFVKTGTADIKTAFEAKKKTAKQRSIANKKRKEQRRAMEEEDEEGSD